MYIYVCVYVYEYLPIYVCTPPCLFFVMSFSCLVLSERDRSFNDKILYIIMHVILFDIKMSSFSVQ